MDMGEVFTALEQGVADGQDNPLATVKTEGWYEVQDYVYDTNHIISSLELFAGEEFWNSLSEEDHLKRLHRQRQITHGIYMRSSFQMISSL